MSELVWSDGLLDEARQVRRDVAAALTAMDVPGELVLTGGTSLPGALTKGDVDLHLRVPQGSFDAVVARLRRVYPVASPHAWAATLAVFDVPGPRPTGLAVTPLHSEHDQRFLETWRALRHSPALLAEYNALKTAATGPGDYERSKAEFFARVSSRGGGSASSSDD
jgi:GrpB-like predicted nucleotidyltransferase (UPF0157 family)